MDTYKGFVFCRNRGWLMENMDKGLTVPKFYRILYFPVWILSEKQMAKEFPTGILLAHKSSRLHLLRLTAGLKQTFVTKHCRFVPIDTSFTLAWDKFDLCKQFLWNQSNESSDSRNQIRQHFCTLLCCSLLHILQEKTVQTTQIFTCHYNFL